MTTNTVVLIAVTLAVLLALAGITIAVVRRFRSDTIDLAGGSILDQAILDAREDAAAQAARDDSGIDGYRAKIQQQSLPDQT